MINVSIWHLPCATHVPVHIQGVEGGVNVGFRQVLCLLRTQHRKSQAGPGQRHEPHKAVKLARRAERKPEV